MLMRLFGVEALVYDVQYLALQYGIEDGREMLGPLNNGLNLKTYEFLAGPLVKHPLYPHSVHDLLHCTRKGRYDLHIHVLLQHG